jgi:tRNA U34 5-methylaminomethyl-2-thiouridine-forming methyltransferase MnmC
LRKSLSEPLSTADPDRLAEDVSAALHVRRAQAKAAEAGGKAAEAGGKGRKRNAAEIVISSDDEEPGRLRVQGAQSQCVPS